MKRIIAKCSFWRLLNGVLVLLCLHSLYSFVRETVHEKNPALMRVTLHSTEPYNTVHVPFVLQDDGLIFVRATLGDRPLECLFDTGAWTVTWPRSFAIKASHLNVRGVRVGAGGFTRGGEQVILSRIRLGGYEVLDVLGLEMEAVPTNKARPYHGATPTGTADIKPILGNDLFKNIVLTIDYREKELILRSKKYDIAHLPHHANDLLLNFKWTSSDGAAAGSPAVPGKLEGQSVDYILDTGWGGMAVTEAFCKRHLSARRQANSTIIGAFSIFPGKTLHDINGSVGDFRFVKSDCNILSNLECGAEAILGYGFLNHFRVTIDYPRQKVLLEPYA